MEKDTLDKLNLEKMGLGFKIWRWVIGEAMKACRVTKLINNKYTSII